MDQIADLVGLLDLQRVMVNNADDDLLVGDHFANCREIAKPLRTDLERDCVGVTSFNAATVG